MKKKTIIITLSIIIIVLAIVTIITIINKNKNSEQEGENPSIENVVKESTDASNITETNILEDVKRDRDVITNDEAKKILAEMYLQAMERYSFNFDTEEENGKIKILRYDEVMNDMFTAYAKEQFETFYKDYITVENPNIYLASDKHITETLDYEIVIKDISISGNTIECTVSTSFVENHNTINTSNIFRIKKDTAKWRIDSFIKPY